MKNILEFGQVDHDGNPYLVLGMDNEIIDIVYAKDHSEAKQKTLEYPGAKQIEGLWKQEDIRWIYVIQKVHAFYSGKLFGL